MSQSVLVRTPDTAVVTVVEARSVVVTPPQPFSSVAVRGVPGPRGPQGVPGPIADLNGAFLVTNRFGEIAADETAKQAARANIGLAVIDGGTFF